MKHLVFHFLTAFAIAAAGFHVLDAASAASGIKRSPPAGTLTPRPVGPGLRKPGPPLCPAGFQLNKTQPQGWTYECVRGFQPMCGEGYNLQLPPAVKKQPGGRWAVSFGCSLPVTPGQLIPPPR